jgi:hypothetical protein
MERSRGGGDGHCTGSWRQPPRQTGWVGCRRPSVDGPAAPATPAAEARRSTASGSSGMRFGGRGDAPDRRRRGQVQVLGELAGQAVQHFAAATSGRSRAAYGGVRPEALPCWRHACRRGRTAGRGRGRAVLDAEDVAEVAVAALVQDGHGRPTDEVTGLRLLTVAERGWGDRQDGRPPDPARVEARGRPDAATRVGASAGPSPGSSLTRFERPARRA